MNAKMVRNTTCPRRLGSIQARIGGQNGRDEFGVDQAIGLRVEGGGESFTGGTAVGTFVLTKESATTKGMGPQMCPVRGSVTDKNADIGKSHHFTRQEARGGEEAQARVGDGRLCQIPTALLVVFSILSQIIPTKTADGVDIHLIEGSDWQRTDLSLVVEENLRFDNRQRRDGNCGSHAKETRREKALSLAQVMIRYHG